MVRPALRAALYAATFVLAACSSESSSPSSTPPESTGGGGAAGATGGTSSGGAGASQGGGGATAGQGGTSSGGGGTSAGGTGGTSTAGTGGTSTAGTGGTSTAGTGGSAGGSAGTSQGGSGGSSAGGSAGSGGETAGSGGGTATGEPCTVNDAEIAMLPTCTAPASTMIDVAKGCAPSVDGTLHASEWADATCFVVGSGDTTIAIKYAGDAVYLASSGNPTCGCPYAFEFDPNGNTTLDGDEFSVNVFDDPFTTNGDRADFVAQNGMFATGMAPAGIVTACPANQPSPIRYEWKIPFSALGITAGSAHAFRLAIEHSGVSFPAAAMATQQTFSVDPSTWAVMSAAADWQ